MSSRTALVLVLVALTGCPSDINNHSVRIAVTSLVSLGEGGVHGNGVSSSPSVSSDGRYVAFVSSSTNLTPAGSGGHSQVYRRDLVTGTTILISVDALGVPGDGDSDSPSISGDGQRVAFRSTARTLSTDASLVTDIYVRDLRSTVPGTILASGAAGGGANDSSFGCFGPSISQDGAFVVFISDASNHVSPNLPTFPLPHVYRYSLPGLTVEIVGLRNDGSVSDGGTTAGTSISADGRFVAFDSDEVDLGAPMTGLSNVYVRDMTLSLNAVVLASPSLDPAILDVGMSSAAPSLSADGKKVAFLSSVPNLVSDDTNGTVKDAFVRDMSDPMNPRTILVSRRSDGGAAENSTGSVVIAPDGRSVAFQSQATVLVDQDFNSAMDIFRHDLGSGRTVRVSVDTAQREGLGSSGPGVALTGDGRFVLFDSEAPNLVTGDTSGLKDVFMRGPLY